MDQNPLLDMLSELDSRMRTLQRERNEAVARARALEGEVNQMVNLIAQVRVRVEKMLKAGTEEEASGARPAQATAPSPPAAAAPPAPAASPGPATPPAVARERAPLGEFSPDPDRLWQILPLVPPSGEEPDAGAPSI